MFKGFKDFLLRGNVVELAVAVVIGAAFGAVVTSFTTSFINPLIDLITGGSEVGGRFTVSGVVFDYGAFITALINFLLIAAVVYFVFVLPINRLMERRKRGEEPEIESPTEDIVLLTEIRDALRSGSPRP